MSQMNTPPRLSADDRYELATIAENQARSNRPRHLISFGIVLIAISLVVLFVAWRAKESAHVKLERQNYKLVNIKQIISEIELIESTQSEIENQRENDTISDIYSRFEQCALQANLDVDIGTATRRTQPMGNSKRVVYPYSVRDPSLTKLLDWITISVDQIPGVGVQEIKLSPEKDNWLVKVSFVRFERNE